MLLREANLVCDSKVEGGYKWKVKTELALFYYERASRQESQAWPEISETHAQMIQQTRPKTCHTLHRKGNFEEGEVLLREANLVCDRYTDFIMKTDFKSLLPP